MSQDTPQEGAEQPQEPPEPVVPTQVPATGPPWQWTGPGDPPPTYKDWTGTTTSTWQPSVQKQQRTWLPWVLVAAIAAVAVVIIAGFWLLGTTDNPVIDTIDPQPNLEEELSGYDTAMSLLEQVWDQEMTYSDQQDICDAWNLGLDEVFLDAMVEEIGTSNEIAGISDTELRSATEAFFDAEC